MSLDEYILCHIGEEHPYLHQLWRATNLHLNYPRMASGHLQGKLLRMIVQMIRPQNILEIGTFTGYSALSMASALEGDAMLHTIEIYDEQEDFTRPWLENSPWAKHIRFYIGDALDMLKDEGAFLGVSTFDLAFIDADKRNYVDYYKAVKPHMRPGGFILADNTLWDGHVVDDNIRESDLQTRGILAFNDFVAADLDVEKVILPIRDGLTMIRVRD